MNYSVFHIFPFLLHGSLMHANEKRSQALSFSQHWFIICPQNVLNPRIWVEMFFYSASPNEMLFSRSRYRCFADEFLFQNTRMLLYDWRHCDTQATNLGYYALLSSLNPLSVFDFLMNLRRFMWQVARQSDWKAVILYSSIYHSFSVKNRFRDHIH